MMMNRTWYKNLLVVFTLLISTQVQALTAGQAAPDFTLKNMQGENLNLAEQRGNIVLINFWASWCGPCRQEMPALEKLQNKYRDLGVLVWGINVEQENQAGRDFLAGLDLSFAIFFDQSNALSESYQVAAMPTTVIVDRDGKVRFIFHGYQSGYEKKYAKAIKQLIRE